MPNNLQVAPLKLLNKLSLEISFQPKHPLFETYLDISPIFNAKSITLGFILFESAHQLVLF